MDTEFGGVTNVKSEVEEIRRGKVLVINESVTKFVIEVEERTLGLPVEKKVKGNLEIGDNKILT